MLNAFKDLPQNYAGIIVLGLATYHGFLKNIIFSLIISPVLVDVKGASIQC